MSVKFVKGAAFALCGVLLVSTGSALAQQPQNLVVNGNFENIQSCPTGFSQLWKAAWRQPTSHAGSSDLFNVCGGASVDVPNNTFGVAPAASLAPSGASRT